VTSTKSCPFGPAVSERSLRSSKETAGSEPRFTDRTAPDVPGHDRPSNLSPHGQMPFLERLDFETRSWHDASPGIVTSTVCKPSETDFFQIATGSLGK